MFIKSLIVSSIIFNFLGFNNFSAKLDSAIIRSEAKRNNHSVEAKELSNIILPDILPRPTVKPDTKRPIINAKYYLLADAESGTVLVKNNAKAEVPIASTTKIMTATVALENFKIDDIVTISEKASGQIGADTFLIPGEKISVLSLLNCLLIKSGNDAAYALAEHMNNSNENGILKFVNKMNEKARKLGMNNTYYNDPAGLDTTGYSSAYDLYIISKYALKKTEFANIVKREDETVKSVDGSIWHSLKNSNRLVAEYKYPGAIGVKTGYMPEAGHVLVGAARRNNHTLITIVLDTFLDTPSASADESKRLLDWGFENMKWE